MELRYSSFKVDEKEEPIAYKSLAFLVTNSSPMVLALTKHKNTIQPTKFVEVSPPVIIVTSDLPKLIIQLNILYVNMYDLCRV